mmetsp:Transcript_997/g.1260  ORF Transcript_997/g.1260 Transcript_997/m.1260 type:complete len:1025 (+) Transcript_997:61-3135(+)
MSGSHLSKDFFELVKAIGESKSKQEEDRIIIDEIAALKKKLHDPSLSKKKSKEFVVRLLYVEMLGHDASFGYIKAIELTASTSLVPKKCGYLVSSLCLSPDHEFRFMLVNQLQRDLNSINHLEVCAALSAVAKLVTADMIPAVINDVVKQLKHENDLVRKKAVMVLHRFHQMDKTSINHLGDQIRRTLCDKDPAVMGAALCIFYDLIRENAAQYKDLVPSFVSILKQVTDHRLPRDYDYHRMPAPWIQMRLLQILGMLGYADQSASEGMYEVLMEVMRRADSGINVGYAIVYESVRTITTIYPNSTLLDAAAASISRFISSDNHNLKYVGVTGLAAIVKEHPKYAMEHQLAVIDCLEDPDETLKRKTLDLLYRMTNSVNVEFVTQKLVHFLSLAKDEFWRSDLVKRITQLAERFAPGNSWYVKVMTKVFELAGDLVRPEVATTVMQLVADGSGEDEEEDAILRTEAVDNFLELIDKPVLPDQLVQTMAWVLGEYGYLTTKMTQNQLMDSLCELSSRNFKETSTKGYIVTALMKLCAQTGQFPATVAGLVETYSVSIQVDLQQRCKEFASLLKTPEIMIAVLPVDASCEDVDLDETLPFLDGYVEQALAAGAVRYSPPIDSDEEEDYVAKQESELKFEAYNRPPDPALAGIPPLTTIDDLVAGNAPNPPAGGEGVTNTPGSELAQLRVTAKVWGRPSKQEEVPPSVPADPSPSNPATALSMGPNATGITQSGPKFPSKKKVESGGAPQDAAEVKTAEQLEKERMAAMLFGGLSGAPPAPAASQAPAPKLKPKPQPAAFQAPIVPQAAPPAPSAPAPAPAPAAPAVDLLDLAFDSPPQSAAPSLTPDLPPSQPPPAPAVATSTEASAPSNPDPFSALDDLMASTLPPAAPTPPLGISIDEGKGEKTAFIYHGHSLQPLPITTPQFGEMWGQCRHEKKLVISQTQIQSCSAFMTASSSKIGTHPVEAIEQTQEAITAGSISGLNVTCLVHAKINAALQSLDVTVKTTDAVITDSLAYFLQQNLVTSD